MAQAFLPAQGRQECLPRNDTCTDRLDSKSSFLKESSENGKYTGYTDFLQRSKCGARHSCLRRADKNVCPATMHATGSINKTAAQVVELPFYFIIQDPLDGILSLFHYPLRNWRMQNVPSIPSTSRPIEPGSGIVWIVSVGQCPAPFAWSLAPTLYPSTTPSPLPAIQSCRLRRKRHIDRRWHRRY